MVCLELTPPSPITTWHLGEQLQTGVVCNGTHLFSAAGSHKTIPSSSILSNNITREKWQFVGMTPIQKESWVNIALLSRGIPLTSLSSIHQHEAKWPKLCLASLGPGAARCSSQLPTSPATAQHNFRLQTPANYNTRAGSEDVCNQTAMTLLCTRVLFPSHY